MLAELIRDWRYEVENGDTVLGFEEWLEHRAERDDNVAQGTEERE